MPYFPRIECENIVNFTTIRSRRSRLWFVGDRQLEEAILGNLAKYTEHYGVKLYAFALEGSHKHELGLYPNCNRSEFFRDFNSSTARAVKRRYSTKFKNLAGEGSLWKRRYSNEFIPTDSDIEDKFFYTVLQPVQDGLVENIKDYPFYNCFYDAINEVEREFPVVDWATYNAHKRWKKDININDYTRYYALRYERLPGYEDLTKDDYKKIMIKKLDQKTREIVKTRIKSGKRFIGRKRLLKTTPGQLAKNPKKSTRYSYRPRILSSCPKTRKEMLSWMFDIIYRFYDASYEYRHNPKDAHITPFPPGTFLPPKFTNAYKAEHGDFSIIS